MFYMQHRGRERVTKVVEFVAKQLNLCLLTVLKAIYVEPLDKY